MNPLSLMVILTNLLETIFGSVGVFFLLMNVFFNPAGVMLFYSALILLGIASAIHFGANFRLR